MDGPWMTPEEMAQAYDRAARFFFGISGDEFTRRWDAGEYNDDDHPQAIDVLLLRERSG